jgi:sugar O-acyltransferase (sialic acid O-acetyltransferase NeuD family)
MVMTIGQVILFGIGSPLLPDYEESLHRAGVRVTGGVRNRPERSYLADGTPSWTEADLPGELVDHPFLVPIFTPAYRQIAAREANALGLSRAFVLLDPTSVVPRRFRPGDGTYINAGCTLGAGVETGCFALINRGANIGHHVSLGAFVSIGPGAIVAGLGAIGDGSVIGAGATVLPGVTIGENAVIGAGSVVTRDVPAGCLAIGSPARIVRENIGGYRGLAVV